MCVAGHRDGRKGLSVLAAAVERSSRYHGNWVLRCWEGFERLPGIVERYIVREDAR